MKERLRVLCENAGAEQDSERLMELVREIDRLLTADKSANHHKEVQPVNFDKAV